MIDEQTVELREVVGVLWRRKVIILGVAFAATALALGLSSRQVPAYQASTRVVLRPVLAPAAFAGSSTRAGTLGLELSPESEAQIIQSPVIAARVKQRLGIETSVEDLVESVQVRLRTTQLMKITTAAHTPGLAAQTADAFAEEYIQYRRELGASALQDRSGELQVRIADIDEAVRRADEQIVQLSAELASINSAQRQSERSAGRGAQVQAEIDRLTAERNEMLGQRAGLSSRLDDARDAQTATSGGGEIIEPAIVPESAATPRPVRDGVLGVIFGLMAGIGAGYLREYFDDRIRTEQDASRIAGAPIAGAIPRSSKWRRRRSPFLATMSDAGSATAEAYRTLRQTLVTAGLGRTIRTVQVTSGGPGAGKSATVANLGVACAQAGLRVIVVSADLRKPRLHAFFGSSNETGLGQVLAGEARTKDRLLPTAISGLSVLPSGPAVQSPATLLDGGHLERVLVELLEVADVVLVDSPPISAGADAMVLAGRGDLSLLTMRRGSARTSGVTAALNLLARAGAPRVATVLNLAEKPTRAQYLSIEPRTSSTFIYAAAGNGFHAPGQEEPPVVLNGNESSRGQPAGSIEPVRKARASAKRSTASKAPARRSRSTTARITK